MPPTGYPQVGACRTRGQVRADLSDYIGGGNKPDVQLKCDRAWDQAVRNYNRVAWSFNRLTTDIVMDSNMKPNASAPTISRDAGTNTGFTLDSGKKIVYWIEERVKVGSQIVKRNDETGGTIATLTGDGTNDKPVITRPALVNPDTTHWALYGSATGDSFPDGCEIAETVAATTTIEDIRTGTNPMFQSPTDDAGTMGNLYNAGYYDLPAEVRLASRAFLVDPQGKERISLIYLTYKAYSYMLGRLGTTTRPLFYTFRNRFRMGQLIIHPRPAQVLMWPVLRFIYDTPIALAGSESDSQLIVPSEVDEGIFQLATAYVVQKHKSPTDAAPLFALARDTQQQLEQEYRDFEDFG